MKFGHISDAAKAFFSAVPDDDGAVDLLDPEILAAKRAEFHDLYFGLAELLDFEWSHHEGVVGGIPVSIMETDTIARDDKVILHLHGGSYCFLKPVTSAALTMPLARACGTKVISVDYRLAPEHPYPAGLEDAFAAYLGLLGDGFAPSDIAVVGESAGGGLSLSLALLLREKGEPHPAALGLFSPWCDLTGRGDSYITVEPHDFMLSWDNDMENQAKAYAGSTPLDDPMISHVYNSDFSALPPTMIQAGTREMLLSDAVTVARKMKSSGVDVSLEIYEGMPHVWQIGVHIPEAKASITEMAAFIRQALAVW